MSYSKTVTYASTLYGISKSESYTFEDSRGIYSLPKLKMIDNVPCIRMQNRPPVSAKELIEFIDLSRLD